MPFYTGQVAAKALTRITHRRFNDQPKGVSLRLWQSGQPRANPVALTL